ARPRPRGRSIHAQPPHGTRSRRHLAVHPHQHRGADPDQLYPAAVDVPAARFRVLAMPYDILIRGGTLYDGSGRAGISGDLAIEGGRIVATGNVGGAAKRTIDASGLAVAPGFIDIKTHSDFTLPINPKAESKVRQGVTTEIIGHCGFSVAPALPGK